MRGPLRLRVFDANLTPGPVVLSIRPHQIALGPASLAPPSSAGENVLRATVLRASYLGDAVDYLIANLQLKQLRLVTHQDVRSRRAGVLQRIGQCLLHNPIGAHLNPGR